MLLLLLLLLSLMCVKVKTDLYSAMKRIIRRRGAKL